MTLRILVKKLELLHRKFITREELKSYCKGLKLDYYTSIMYLTSNNYIVRVLRGIFYVKSIEERKLNKLDISFEDAISEALSIKGVKKWYFGLESAIKLNNITHEYFAVETIISDKLSRPNPFDIMGRKVRFVKLNGKLLEFGIIKNKFNYSDAEKTILDFVYLGKYNRNSDEGIKNKVAGYIGDCKKSKLREYSENYPKTVGKLVEELVW